MRLDALLLGGAIVATLSATLAGTAARAAEEELLDLGARSFREACAGCHGAEARGDGPLAALLSVPVPDLSLLAQREGGFDRAEMLRRIDSGNGMVAHGGPMPVFGGLLRGPSAVVDAEDGSPIQTTEPILAIVTWLETLQRAAPE